LIARDGSVIGIDVGCSLTRRSSAICRLDWSGSTVSWEIVRFSAQEPERERAIAQLAANRPILAAAFDGPIRRGFGTIDRYRTAERMLTRRLRPLIGKPGQSSAPVGKKLNHHANECVRHLVAHCDVQDARHGVPIDSKALVEAFPSSFLGMMIESPEHLIVSRNDRSDIFFQHLADTGVLHALIEYCLPGRELAHDLSRIVNHDDRAAFVCALSALCVATGDFVAVGDHDGWIILPPQRFIQSEQWSLLDANAREEVGAALHIEGFTGTALATHSWPSEDVEFRPQAGMAGSWKMYISFGALFGFIFAVLIGLSPVHLDTYLFLACCGALIGLYLGWLRRRGLRWGDIGMWALIGFISGLASGRRGR
jgi:hypothetical protein